MEWKIAFNEWSAYYFNGTVVFGTKDIVDAKSAIRIFSHEHIHAALDKIGEREACKLLDNVINGFERGNEAHRKFREVCDTVNSCETRTGLDCLGCDAYWEWRCQKENCWVI